MENIKTLKLDSSFRPVEIINSVEALVMCILGKARAIESHTKKIRTITDSFLLPSVIVLNRYIKFRFSYVACNRTNLFFRDQSECQYCGKEQDGKLMTIDHILPKSRGGKNTWENLVVACKKCNQRKGNKTPLEAGMKLRRIPKRPKNTLMQRTKKEQINPQWSNYLWE
jgi:5-methylcytosine-specific restriction endonuclease McrA